MKQEDYSPDQIKDIEERVEKARNFLTELQLQPAVVMQMANNGKDIFGIQAIPYLKDQKYLNVVSPIQKI